MVAQHKQGHRWRMRITLTSELANTYLLPILSPIFGITETWGVPLIITMDMNTFGMFMDAVTQSQPGEKIGSFYIERVDLNKEPHRLVFNHGRAYDEEER